MKHKSNWLKELGMSFLFLGVFALIRFILIAQRTNLQISDEIIAGILATGAIVTLFFSFFMGNLRNIFSFSFDAWLLVIIGLFLWNLEGIADSVLWFTFGIFGLFTVASAWAVLNLFWKNHYLSEKAEKMMELHDFINRCLGIKFLAMVFGTLLIEKLLVPIIAG